MPPSETSQSLQVLAYQADNEILAVFQGHLILDHCQQVSQRLHELMDADAKRFYIDMEELDHVDSAGWGVIVGFKRKNDRTGAHTCFLTPTARIMAMFRISKLDSIFEIKSDPEASEIRDRLKKPEFELWIASYGQSPPRTDRKNLDDKSSTSTSPNTSESTPPRTGEIERLSKDAVEHLRHGDYHKAIENYSKVLKIDSEDITALNNLGVIYEKYPQWRDKAIQTWTRVQQLSQRRHDAKHAERARQHLEKIMDKQAD